LKNHILDMTFCSAAVADNEAKTTAFNILGEKMTFERITEPSEENENRTNEVKDSDDSEEILINGKAKMMVSDLMGTNGVIHVIDSLLETESGLPISTMLGNRNLTIFKKLMDYGNFDDEFDSLNNATYFVPTDNAFENSKIGKYWIEQLDNSPQKLKNNPQLKEFLEYHVAQPLIKTCDLKEEMLPTKSGSELRVNLYSTVRLV
jgi:transforming growth factor-beta-induced protein